MKGGNIKYAVEQLKSSLQNIKVTGKKHAFVVASKNNSPNATTERQKWEKMFRTQYAATFDIKNVSMSKPINKLK